MVESDMGFFWLAFFFFYSAPFKLAEMHGELTVNQHSEVYVLQLLP